MKKGKFIVMEGGDGSGKSTHTRLLVEGLCKKGYAVFSTCEPSHSEIGKLIRRYLSGELEAPEATIASLFLADRILHIEGKGGIKEHLEKGANVICDRYYLSSMAYNCMSESIDWVFNLNLRARDLLKPDLVIYLKADEEETDKRLGKRESMEIYETKEFQRKVLNRYQEAMDRLGDNNVKVVSTVASREEVAKEILKIAEDLIAE